MINKSLITIGITCYNCEKTIRKTIASAINQDWKNKEIILIEDFSNDKSKKIIKELKIKYPKLKVKFNNKNYGYAYCLNLIIKQAKGKFVAFFDGDDVSKTTRITKQYNKYLKYQSKNPKSKIFVYSNRNVFHGNKLKFSRYGIGRNEPEPHGKIVADYILNIKDKSDKFCWGMFGSCTLFTKTNNLKNLKGLDVKFSRSAELDLAVRAAKKGFHFISSNEKLIKQNLTFGTHKTIEKDFQARIQLIEKHQKYIKKKGLYFYAKMNFYAWYWYCKKVNLMGHFFNLISKCILIFSKLKY